MSDKLQTALAKATSIMHRLDLTCPVSKTIWGSPAGKKRIADRLAALLPPHKTYVEPFAGSAAVLFAKEPAEVEAINDADPEIAKAYRILKGLTESQLDRLRKMKWTGDEATFKGLIKANPADDAAWLHRFLYLTHFSYGKMRGKSFSPSVVGIEAKTIKRIETFGPRLKKVHVYGGDYEKVVRKYDSPSTVFFLDPPYPGYNVNVGESDFDEDRFFALLKSLKGKFLLTYGVRGKLPGLLKKSSFQVRQIRTPRTIGTMQGVGGPSMLTQLVVANYPLPNKLSKLNGDASDDELLLQNWTGEGTSDQESEEIDKRQPFGTFGGSYKYAKRLIPLIPAHKTYVEPFAGAAAVLYAKEPSTKEVLGDVDDDVIFLHRFIKSLDDKKLDRLRTFNWKSSESSWQQVRNLAPKDDYERFYKLAFTRSKGRDGRPDATHLSGSALGSTTDPTKYLKAAERLKDVSVIKQDYRKTIKQFDGPDTFFFIDPPYPGEWFDKDAAVDIDEFIAVLKGIRGKFIAVLNSSRENLAAFKSVGHVFKLKVVEASGTGGSKHAYRIFCSNFKVAKGESATEHSLQSDSGSSPEPAATSAPFNKSIELIKGADPNDERYVLGIVLEPEVVDAQGDIYSAEEVRHAAHKFMEEFGGLGLMHRFRVNDQVKVLESYLAPADHKMGNATIKKGTWLFAVRILSDELWQQVKDGKLTGFSIGGSARRLPDTNIEPTERTPENKSDTPVHKAASSAPSQQDQDDSTRNRLLDIVVEEVSLVDRAANKHRFLIVKRSESMDESTIESGQGANASTQEDATQSGEDEIIDLTADLEIEDNADAAAESAATSSSTENQPPADETAPAQTADLNTALTVITELVEAVDTLSQADGGAHKDSIIQCAGELQSAAQRLTALAGKDDVSSDAQLNPGTPPRGTEDAAVNEALSSVRALLARATALFDKAADPNQPDSAGTGNQATDTTVAATTPDSAPMTQGNDLATRLQALTDAIREQQGRIGRLEKRFGLPNSLPAAEHVNKAADTQEVGWPLDLNRSCDRASVDKAVSFHDL